MRNLAARRQPVLCGKFNAHIFTHESDGVMPSIETNTRKIVARLQSEGWSKESGGKHDKYKHREKPGVLIVVPRHTEQSIGVARSIANRAGWR